VGSGVLTASNSAFAGGGVATDAYEGIDQSSTLDVHGLADFYLQHNFNKPASGTNQLRPFDVRSDEPYLNLLRMTLSHPPERFGFRLDVGLGDTSNGYLRSDPAASDHPEISRTLSYVEQAFVTAVVPLGNGIAIDLGKFGTPIGLEDNETPQNWNYSRSLLYTLAEPTYHTGLRLTYAPMDAFAWSLFWVNGWDANVLAGNGMRAVGAAVSWRPAKNVEVVVDYMGGLERAPMRLSDPTLAFRNELDVYASYALTDHVSFAFTADYGHDAADGGVVWWGVGGYLRCRVLPWLAGALRGEHYADPAGFTSGTKQRLVEATATIEVSGKVREALLIGRIEYRRDQSDEHTFEGPEQGRLTRQDTLTLGLMAAF
jgi:hypothetical protein